MPDDQPSLCGACGSPAVVQWRRRNSDDPTHTNPVFSCPAHAIHLDAAAQVHQTSCSAPSASLAPGCDCTPEPLPPPEPMSGSGPTVTLSTGWVVPTPSAT